MATPRCTPSNCWMHIVVCGSHAGAAYSRMCPARVLKHWAFTSWGQLARFLQRNVRFPWKILWYDDTQVLPCLGNCQVMALNLIDGFNRVSSFGHPDYFTFAGVNDICPSSSHCWSLSKSRCSAAVLAVPEILRYRRLSSANRCAVEVIVCDRSFM